MNDLVRTLGTNLRSSLNSVYGNYGHEIGRQVAIRFAWEIGDVVAEIHGRGVAVGLLYKAADALVATDRTGALMALTQPESIPTELEAENAASPEPEPPADRQFLETKTILQKCIATAKLCRMIWSTSR